MQVGLGAAADKGELKRISVKSQTIPDVEFIFVETPTARPMVEEIFHDNYRVLRSKMIFNDGDVVVDAGANEGMFSIFLSKHFPQIKIYAFEPVPETYATLIENIKLNDCKNIIAHNLGLGESSAHKATLVVANNFSGGSSGVITFDKESQHQVEVGIIGLDRAMDMCGVDKVKLLKMDIEGMEYDVLYDSEFFDDKKVENFTGEIHINMRLEFKCYRMEGLITWIANRSRIIHVETCKMAE